MAARICYSAHLNVELEPAPHCPVDLPKYRGVPLACSVHDNGHLFVIMGHQGKRCLRKTKDTAALGGCDLRCLEQVASYDPT